MSDPITIPLSAHQADRFRVLQLEQRAIAAKLNDAATMVVAGQVDPASLVGWRLDVQDTQIVCTPPAG